MQVRVCGSPGRATAQGHPATEDIPELELYFGRPSGSAMPLAWAHAEYIKLRRSLAEGRVFDLPLQTWQRYVVEQVESKHVIWRPNHRRGALPAGKVLRILLDEPAAITFQCGEGPRRRIENHETGLGIFYADLPTADLPADEAVRFCFDRPTMKWLSSRDWYVIRCGDVMVERREQMPVETPR